MCKVIIQIEERARGVVGAANYDRCILYLSNEAQDGEGGVR